MPGYKLTDAAQNDLRDISAYTVRKWGRKQEKLYRESIRATLKILAMEML